MHIFAAEEVTTEKSFYYNSLTYFFHDSCQLVKVRVETPKFDITECFHSVKLSVKCGSVHLLMSIFFEATNLGGAIWLVVTL